MLQIALYICTLDMLRSQLKDEDLKYPTLRGFCDVYGDRFQRESEEEQEKLRQHANWTSILFKVVGKLTIKGLAMSVIPKLLEGWHGMNDLLCAAHTYSIVLLSLLDHSHPPPSSSVCNYQLINDSSIILQWIIPRAATRSPPPFEESM